MKKIIQTSKYIWTHPANKNNRIKRLSRAIIWQIYKRLTGNYWDLQVFQNIRVRCYPDSVSTNAVVYTEGFFDYHEMNFIQHYLQPGDNFIDIGANVGIYTLLAASIVGKQGNIDAFEPSPKVLGRLQENIKLNELINVKVHAVAVGESSGTIQFTQVQESSLNHIQTNSTHSDTDIEVPCVSLDDLLSDNQYMMCKMDIEGAELFALRGAKNMLSAKNPPVWLLEINPPQLRHFGFSREQLLDLFNEYGYDILLYNANLRQFYEITELEEKYNNVFAIARQAREMVARRVCKNIN